jgi:hypothetical protein
MSLFWCALLVGVAGCNGPVDSGTGGIDGIEESVVANDSGDAAVEPNDVASEISGDADDSSGEAWAPSCTPADNPGPHDPAYDSACTQNTGCTHRGCLACTSSCVLCDGPRCVGVVSDDSCMVSPGVLFGLRDEPGGGVPAQDSGATLAILDSDSGALTLSLSAGPDVPSVAVWLDLAGTRHSRPLALPVTRIADRVLVEGAWTLTNYCTGQVMKGSVPVHLVDGVLDSQGQATAALPFDRSDPWTGSVAWIRLFEDADGMHVYQWFQPGAMLEIGYGSSGSVPAQVAEPIPEDEAVPLGSAWDSFDWVAAFATSAAASSR